MFSFSHTFVLWLVTCEPAAATLAIFAAFAALAALATLAAFATFATGYALATVLHWTTHLRYFVEEGLSGVKA